MNMKYYGCHNVRKHRGIKGSGKYVTLNISLKFDSLGNIKITYSESKDNLGRSGKGFITSLGLNIKTRPKKYKKASYVMEISVRRTFQIILWSLKNYLMKVMRGRGPNMNLLTFIFT